MTEMKDLVGTTGSLNLSDPIRCARCLGYIPAPGIIEVDYVGKGEDDITHAVRDEFNLRSPARCPFCGCFTINVFLDAKPASI